ncbi:Glycosyltransferase, catalytic subunit of cellulose synthase and poly-beta-1,6-N-acetylglucosamine synthase [Streptomyces zhaozhouensis]|uniref:Glycosyltransferase, catalytic subunit of cellulose synthase and poly-beta-1,6-N-acetylglucosamine synthase n=1 Tax=Streptomyces zhaozhouensis TaxID=1300267 RepID=A0A286DL31_9ACTN|nr:cellulose synthase catalytic subunit [Streptomyces zhaozhouensis]SOD59293.1 Glycosyltransferase, catalytic subunit of cellulose synthase and poly-beta-1,6-N-acetylglucosamine synthase [Streptomyces zhaozhouensis]
MRSQRYDYEVYSRLAGPLTEPGPGYRVRYRSLLAREPHRTRATLLMALAPTLSLVLLVWLVWPSHWTERSDSPVWLVAADAVMLGCIALIELFRLVNVVSVAHATMVARDPVPVAPETGTRVAFLTTFVPGKEPLTMVRGTLEGAVRLRHTGPLDVWLLDEGDDPQVREMCAELGVHHFTRRGVARWNQPSGPHRARTKHGNYNAWLDAHGDDYDYFASVDTDHVPLPGFLERMLGYFRDPDVAFVVGPQVYGNYEGPVTKSAESQQFLFHALIQRAGNRYRSPMFVGTNNAVRIAALRTVGGLCDSVTEDMATGFELHRTVNPETGNRWRSVYTPDVLAVGEGPSSWTDFFTQQLRWSRGTYETLIRQYGRGGRRHRPGTLLNYSLMLAFYPMAAITWTLGVLGCVLYLLLGASGTQVSSSVWLMLYSDVAALQVGLYVWNRRHNVSPHEPEGSSGTAGMLMSALSAPVYARSLLDAVLRRTSGFVVTPKGGEASPDRPATFRWHLGWAGLLTFALLVSVVLGHTHVAMRSWALIALAVALAPPAVWAWTTREPRRRPTGRHRAAGPRARPGAARRPAPVPEADAPNHPGGERPPRRPVGADA